MLGFMLEIRFWDSFWRIRFGIRDSCLGFRFGIQVWDSSLGLRFGIQVLYSDGGFRVKIQFRD